MNNQVFKRSFWLPHIALPTIVGLILAFIYPHTSIDTWLIQPYFDAHARLFPLKNDYFLEGVMHVGLRNLMIVVSLVMLCLWLSGLKVFKLTLIKLQNKQWILTYHRQFLWVFVAMVITTSTISILKHQSIHSCPWDLLSYGGTEPWIPLFGHLPAGVNAGHCFPGGHASGGFALMALYFGFRDTLPKLANIGLMLGLAFGLMMGWTQMMRGAHFMSHNLWTAWIVWVLLVAQYIVWSPITLKSKT
ncbi:MAG: phosphatase PAP2 family protein [Methylophilaceae bacterium]